MCALFQEAFIIFKHVECAPCTRQFIPSIYLSTETYSKRAFKAQMDSNCKEKFIPSGINRKV